jgi:hypothetical protein
MKKILFLFALLLSGTTAMAQQHLVSVTGGVNFSNTMSGYVNSKFKAGPLAGLDYEYNSKGLFTFGTGIWFNQTGNLSHFTFTDEVGQELKEVRIQIHSNYISLPLLVGIKTQKSTFFYGNIGIVPSLLLNAVIVSDEPILDVSQTGKEKTDITDQYSIYDIPFQLQLGAGFRFNEKFSAQTGLMFQYSIFKVLGTDGNRFGNHYGLTPMLALKYGLGDKKVSE